MKAEQLTEADAEHGEGPVWSPSWGGPSLGELRWVDTFAGDLLALGDDGTVTKRNVDKAIGALRPRAGGGMIVALERRFALAGADGELHPLGEVWDTPGVQFNDGGCDPQGRFYCGTMAYAATPGAGTLYRLDPDLSVHEVLTGVTISNGIQWPAEGVYYNDTPTGRVDRYAFDPGTGTFGARETLAAIDPAHGRPDGMALDAEGGVWVALWGGGAVHRYAGDGTLTAQIAVPARQTTACTFGDDTTLFITTSRDGLGDQAEPGAGAVFAVDAGVRGARPYAFAG